MSMPADRNTLVKVLSLYGIPDKQIKVISAMYKNNILKVKVGSEIFSRFVTEPTFKQGYIVFFLYRKWQRLCKTLLDLNYLDGLSILDRQVI